MRAGDGHGIAPQHAAIAERAAKCMCESVRSRNRHSSTGIRPALGLLGRLASSASFDVSTALRKDRSLEPEHLYYVAFHFAEEKASLGADLLREVVKNAGRTKIGKMAKNKLSLLGHADV